MKSEENLGFKLNGFPSIACDGGVAGAAERTDGVVDEL
jgi:hypothetical protein